MLIHDSMAQSTWNKLYDYRVFNDIRYPEQYIIDDFATTYRIINKAEVVICTNSILYNYVIERSGCCSSTRNIRYAKDWVAIWQKKRADLQEWGYDIQEYDLRNALGLLSKYGHIEGVTEPLEAMIDSFEGYPQSMDAKRKIMLYIYRKSKKIFELACMVSGKRI